nr:hypothetical protein CFP56_42993 [Quercus suber]
MHMATEFYFFAGKTFTKKSKAETIVYWEKPEVNWFKLNKDGSSIGNPRKAIKDVLYRRGIEIDTRCGGCGEIHETILHVLCDCCIASKLWKEAGATSYVPNFFNMDLNNSVFKEKAPSQNTLWTAMHMATEFYFFAGKTFTKKSKAETIVYWEKPEVNWFKLNKDGSSIGNPRKASEGGLIRDHRGN